MKPFQIDEEAEAELVQAVEYYDRQRPGLGDEFYAEVAKLLDQIQKTPDRWATLGQTEVCKCSLKGFPYSIIYIDLSEEIQVVAVAHQKRRLGYWQDRI